MEGVQIVRLQVIGDQRMLLVISDEWLYAKEDKDKIVLSKKPMEN